MCTYCCILAVKNGGATITVYALGTAGVMIYGSVTDNRDGTYTVRTVISYPLCLKLLLQ
jgi:hypothetical protein